MFDHVEIPVADLPRSRRFYDAALASLGIMREVDIAHRPPLQRGIVGYGGDGTASFALLGGRPAIGLARLGFRASSCSAVAEFLEADTAAGGRVVAEPVFLPRTPMAACQVALLDPEGYRVEVFCEDAD